MKSLSKRLEGLEQLIHTSLHELVLIAGFAGVPDKKEVKAHEAQGRLDHALASLRSLTAGEKTEGMLTGSMNRVLMHLADDKHYLNTNTNRATIQDGEAGGHSPLGQSTKSNNVED